LRDGADSASCIKEKAKQKELEADVDTKSFVPSKTKEPPFALL
jgi:hypothetical protein